MGISPDIILDGDYTPDNRSDGQNGGGNTNPPRKMILPEDITLLAQIRDDLQDYLGTLERNTDAVIRWVADNQDEIILRHHQLMRAIYQKDEAKAMAIADETEKTGSIGFILSLQDFNALAETAFGADSTFYKFIEDIERGVPYFVLEDLPVIDIPTDRFNASADIALALIEKEEKIKAEAANAPEEEKKSGGGLFGGIFKSKAQKEKERLEEEARQQRKKEAEDLNAWRMVRNELTSIEGEKHYYIDSTMDWLDAMMSTEDEDKPVDHLMDSYKDPQYVIDTAQKDYDRVVGEQTGLLKEKALQYSGFASLLDGKDVGRFTVEMYAVFKGQDKARASQYRRLLLKDLAAYGATFADIAMNYVKDRADQVILLEAAALIEDDLSLTGSKTKADVFEKILSETLAPQNPLHPRAIEITLRKFFATGWHPEKNIALDKAPTPFQRITDRFADDYPAMELALTALLNGIRPQSAGQVKNVVNFIKAYETSDAALMSQTLETIRDEDSALSFNALWNLCCPGSSVSYRIIQTDKDDARISKDVRTAVEAGLLDDFKINAGAAYGGTDYVFALFHNHAVANPDAFDIENARFILAHALTNGGLNTLRTKLTAKDGWLAAVAGNTNLTDKKKAAWVAVLLEPFASDFTKANILYQAAQNADGTVKDGLLAAERALIGDAVRIGMDRILTSLSGIANIWYVPENRTIRYTQTGKDHIILESVSPAMAEDVLSVLQRRGNFTREFDTLMNVENIDRIKTEGVKTIISWTDIDAAMPMRDQTADALHKRPDFITETLDGDRFSMNQRSILTVEKTDDDKYRVMDKYGYMLILDGDVDFTPADYMLRTANGWINPKNASLISVDPDNGTISLRVESAAFDEFMEAEHDNDYLYTLSASEKQIAKIEEALLAEDGIAAPAAKKKKSLYFNMNVLGYLRQEENSESGFYCVRFKDDSPGFIPADEDLAEKVIKGFSKDKNFVTINNIITHKSAIDDIFYNEKYNELYIVTDTNTSRTTVDPDTALDLISKLVKKGGLTPIDYTVKDGKTVPVEAINLPATSMLFYNQAEELPYIYTRNNTARLGMTESETHALFDLIETESLAASATGTAPAWVAHLKTVQHALPEIDVVITPSLTEKSAQYMLNVVLGARGDDAKPLPRAQADFSIAADRKLKSGDIITYPANRRAPPAAGSPRK